MKQPEIVRCADGHFRKVIWGLGPYIADYPEQVLLACIVTNWCPRWVLLKIEYSFLSDTSNITLRSCRAPPWDLDGEYSDYPRTEEHTETLAQSSSVAALWRDHGIVLDVIVGY